MFWLIYSGCSIIIGTVKAFIYTSNYPQEKMDRPMTIFFIAFIVSTIFAPLLIIDFIIGGIKRVKFHKQDVSQT